MKAILIALLLTSFPARAATLAEYADAHLSDEIEKRLRRKRCDCTCLNEAKTMHETRVILRQDAPNLPDLGDEGQDIDDLRAENHCDDGSASGTASGGASTRRASMSAYTGSSGSSKMTLPEGITAEDFDHAFNKLDMPWRAKFAESMKRSTDTSFADALKTLDAAQREKFVGGLPCFGQQSLNDWLAKHREPVIDVQPFKKQ